MVVCTFNEGRVRQLMQALAALARQSRPPLEVLVVVDNNPALLGRLRSERPDVRAIPNVEGAGLAGARNSGLAAAAGEVVAFLDDDAVPEEDWLERLTAPYADPDVAGVGGEVLPVWETERPEWLPDEFLWVVGCSYRGLPAGRSPVRNFIGANMSFRRELFDQVGGFCSSLGRIGSRPLGCEETELCIRLHSRGTLLYEPRARVRHWVPRERARWSYFLARCLSEGISKAEVTRLAGRRSGLASERAYVRRTLPAALLRCARAPAAGGGLLRAAAIVAGLAATLWGYLGAPREAPA